VKPTSLLLKRFRDSIRNLSLLLLIDLNLWLPFVELHRAHDADFFALKWFDNLAQAIGREVLKAGSLVLYRSIFDLVRELLTQETQVAEGRLLKKYLKPDLLIIDDMGLKILPPKSGEILLEIIMRRYENRSTMMTSNRPIEEWGKLLSDVPAASAILDRLLHHAEIIPINGRSYRLQKKPKQTAS
jgi:DNA replication protein DnaC